MIFIYWSSSIHVLPLNELNCIYLVDIIFRPLILLINKNESLKERQNTWILMLVFQTKLSC